MASEDELLRILDEHGKNFLSSFAPPLSQSATGKRKRVSDVDEEEEEEWYGIPVTSNNCGEESDTENDFEQIDDDFVAAGARVVVFSDPLSTSKKHDDPILKSQKKSFMSSRINKLTADSEGMAPSEEQGESEEERSNAQNDALLHRLIHTQLLSGSRDTELDLTPAQRKRALAGRILELAGAAKLGKGEKEITEAERRRAGKRVREGLANKQKGRQKQRLEEAKDVGNYHPTIKRVFEGSNGTKTSGRRNRGLKMGVGRFKGGVLRLSKEDISKVEGAHIRSSKKR